ncbi:hypothetical protein KW850_20645 [Bacillus sp. sid0103]|uniref:hypothetical protein n=1 Tax=Bacillus sp. sid0103 TaxID=2856337 RepID=UPI001C460CEE|nr:hypothetical protein [Bacillus sp. sid0103]MBV7507644.1 hypothetical protein [Bacillus sp. sid0103]
MNTKVKKGIFWGVIVASTVLIINVLHFLLGGGALMREAQKNMARVEWVTAADLAGAAK